jgi:uroporphyrinogen-III synthase
VALIDALGAGGVDAIAFTSASQVDRLWQVARAAGADERLANGLARVQVAAIGPIAVEALSAHGTRIDVVPDKGFVMRRLVGALIAALGRPA